jgi:6-pyruvoyltetrahydropterin/6-carboxytetrahydropterin synthase
MVNAGFCNGVDFNYVDTIIKPLVDQLDHRTLNDIIPNPTAECIAQWFLDNANPHVFYSIKVWETSKCWAMAINADGLFPKVHKE